ncbi:hypothetical protein FT663_01377 [Candidozyma haemuli var. vulneris]|uniref:mRNA export factor GLE1 n=1 Tax=Candidozyma haemuli TaxID=45357 RepID=A0A2V1AYY4_9ASCO|nr:hypothetical protein CXQ85_002781 [[Candida] haemuloni]KAF3992512.1 hypothetical protein FT662_01058 [[Candida] haemuloni var. vulneris]KAF3994464.1 hypothetical protein FT663_01377 [[Candida] haemuloni var. vulneris]PVH23055.1 hypothetical protein CXQ85_002781 [[Candida] haemuloni]
MRFGLPSDGDVVYVPAPRSRKVKAGRFLAPTNLADQITDALGQLELQNIEKYNEEQDKRLKSFKSYYNSQNSHTNQLLGALDATFEVEQSSQESTIKDLFLYEQKLREEEEERKRQLEIKRKEEERKRIEEEKRKAEEEKRRLEEERKEALRKREEEKKKEELAKQKKEAEEKERLRQKKLKEDEEKRKRGGTDWKEVAKEVEKWRTEIANIKEKVVAPINQNKDLKKQMNVLRRKVTVKFGQLSNSRSQCNSACSDIHQLVEPTRSNPGAYHWLLNSIAKALISQAEAEVIVKPTASLPLALVTNNLLRSYPEFDYYLTARFVKKCCFTLGYSCAIDTEEGRRRMGWKRTDDKWEDEVKYEERIGGIMTLWAAISNEDANTEHGLFNRAAQWRSLARLLNTDTAIIINVHYVVVGNWWEVAAKSFFQVYRGQATKLFNLIEKAWSPVGRKKSYPAATRLELLVEACWKGNFSTIKEMER